MNLIQQARERVIEVMIKGVTCKHVREREIEGNMGMEIRRDFSSEVTDEVQFCAMICDHGAIKVLTRCCKTYDTIENGVTIIESLDNPHRQPIPNLDAIFFIEPTRESVERMIRDCMSKNCFRNVHVFFTHRIPDDTFVVSDAKVTRGFGGIVRRGKRTNSEQPDAQMTNGKSVEVTLMDIIARSVDLTSKIKSLVQLNLSFVPYESRIFHLNMPSNLVKVKAGRMSDRTTSEVASKLLTVFSCLGDQPVVCYARQSAQAAGPNNAQQVAETLVKEFGTGEGLPCSGNTHLYIMDRTVDVNALLFHGWSWQAIIYDILGVTVSGVQPYRGRDAEGKEKPPPQSPDGLFPDDCIRIKGGSSAGDGDGRCYFQDSHNEEDANRSLWMKIKHQDWTNVADVISKEIASYRSSNAFEAYKKSDQGTGDMRQLAANAQGFQVRLKEMTDHQSSAIECTDGIRQQALTGIMAAEQSILTGVDDHGKYVVAVTYFDKTIAKILVGRDDVPWMLKLRLILLFFVNVRNIPFQVVSGLFEWLNKQHHAEIMVRKFLNLGFVEEDLAHEKGADLVLFSATKGVPDKDKAKDPVCQHRLLDDAYKEKLARNKRRAKAVGANANRYTSPLHEVMEAVCQGRSSHIISFSKAASSGNTVVRDTAIRGDHEQVADINLRAREKKWDWTMGENQNTQNTKSKKQNENKTRSKHVVIYVLGGIMMSELRFPYDLSNEIGIDVSLGGCAIFTPEGALTTIMREAPEPQDEKLNTKQNETSNVQPTESSVGNV